MVSTSSVWDFVFMCLVNTLNMTKENIELSVQSELLTMNCRYNQELSALNCQYNQELSALNCRYNHSCQHWTVGTNRVVCIELLVQSRIVSIELLVQSRIVSIELLVQTELSALNCGYNQSCQHWTVGTIRVVRKTFYNWKIIDIKSFNCMLNWLLSINGQRDENINMEY